MIGRLRLSDIVLGLLGIAAGASVLSAAAFEGPSTDLSIFATMPLTRWLMLAVALLAVLDPIAVVTRRTATGGLFIEVALFWLSLPTILLAGVRLFLLTPDVGGASLDPAPAGLAIFLVFAGVFCSALWAMRDESRGLAPSPGAPVEVLGEPRVHGAPDSN